MAFRKRQCKFDTHQARSLAETLGILDMVTKKKRIIVALAMVVGLLFLPFGATGYVIVFGGEYPLIGSMLGFFVGVVACVILSVIAVSMWRAKNWRGFVALTAFVCCFSFAWIPLGWTIGYITSPYSRDKVAFDEIQSPTVDVSGVWHGNWTDTRKEFSEKIILSLQQNNSKVTGTIVSERKRSFDIVDGVVSGDRVNLYYNVSFPEWPLAGGGGTLVGTVENKKISGTWFAHERPKHGWSIDGPWEATFRGMDAPETKTIEPNKANAADS